MSYLKPEYYTLLLTLKNIFELLLMDQHLHQPVSCRVEREFKIFRGKAKVHFHIDSFKIKHFRRENL